MLCSTMKYSATSTLTNRAFPFLLNGRFGGEEIIRRGQPSTGRCGQYHRQQRSSKHCWFDIEIHHHETYHRSSKYPLLLSFEKNPSFNCWYDIASPDCMIISSIRWIPRQDILITRYLRHFDALWISACTSISSHIRLAFSKIHLDLVKFHPFHKLHLS